MAAAFLRQTRVDAECVLIAGGVNGWRRLRCNMRFVNAFATSRRGARVNMPNTLAPPIAKQTSSLAWCTSGNQHASRKRDAGGDGIAQSEVPGVRFLAPSRASLQGLARTHRRPAKLLQRRALIHVGCGLAAQEKGADVCRHSHRGWFWWLPRRVGVCISVWALLLASSQSRSAESFAVRNSGCKQRYPTGVSTSGPMLNTIYPPLPDTVRTGMKLPETSRQRSEEARYANGVVFLSSSAWEADPLMRSVRLSLMGSERVKSSNIHC